MSWDEPRFPHLLQLRIDEELYNELLAKAKKDKTTMSEIVRSACREKLAFYRKLSK